MMADPFVPGAIAAEAEGTTLIKAHLPMNTDREATWLVAKTLSHVLGVAAAILLTACQAAGSGRPGVRTAAGPPTDVTPAAWTYANRLVDRFEADRARSGMVGVISDIEDCYAGATQPRVDRLRLRQCMVFDTFAVRLNMEVARSMPGVGGDLHYLQTHAAVLRANRNGPLAGFNDPEVLSGYLIQGSNLRRWAFRPYDRLGARHLALLALQLTTAAWPALAGTCLAALGWKFGAADSEWTGGLQSWRSSM